MSEKARLAVILVNWRNAPDTIECLETLLRSTIPLHVIVCDNGSGDGSVEKIKDWANGDASISLRNPALSYLTESPLPRPISFEHLRPGQSEASHAGPETALTLIETGGNLGYAGGNNVGLRFALKNPDVTHFWLLNNDTVVTPGTAAALLAAFDTRPDIGMMGTDLRLYDEPDRFQMQSGLRFDRWTARGYGIGAGGSIASPLPPEEVERQTDFICGASMTVTRAFLETVGLLEERYFLYYEEIDWAIRSRGRFKLGYCPDAVVFHKEGASAGSSFSGDARSPLSEYHHARSKRIFARLHFPLLLPAYFGFSMLQAARRLSKGKSAKAAAILRGWAGLPFVKPAASGR